MPTLHEDIGDFINNRIQEAYQDIKDEPKFKTIRKDILGLEDHIRQSIPSGLLELFDEYTELIGQREAFMEEMVYRAGFKDGFHISTHNR